MSEPQPYAPPRAQPQREELWGHPRGLYILFFTELWERFSYYGMRALLVLFLTAESGGGYGWTEDQALTLYQWYTALVYFAAIPGGLLADRVFGQRRTVLFGAILLVAGHLVMAFPPKVAFFSALFLIVSGVGLLKPNVSTMVGGLYPPGDNRRDRGFTIFYIGINIGALSGPLATGAVAAAWGWHYGFGLAGIGMALGILFYLLGQRHLDGVGEAPKDRPEPTEAVAEIPPEVERDRTRVLLISFLIVVVFWAAYEQAGGLLNLYAKTKIDRAVGGVEIPAAMFQSVPAFFVITLGVPIGLFWAWWARADRPSSAIVKMGFGTIVMGLGFGLMAIAATEVQIDADGQVVNKAALWMLVGAYLLHVVGELCVSPVALSYITKLAPARYGAIMMGVYFAMTGLGNLAAGEIGKSASKLGDFNVFAGIMGFCALFGLVLLLARKPLERMAHGAEDEQ